MVFLSLLTVCAATFGSTRAAFAQQATIAGTVTDTSGGVLPGVTITVVHEETGNTFEAVTDAPGPIPYPGPRGCPQADRESLGFPDLTRTGLQLLLNQTLSVSAPAGAGDARRDRHRHGRGAARRYEGLHRRRQHRPAAGAGAADQRPQLDGPDAARARAHGAMRAAASCRTARAMRRPTSTASRSRRTITRRPTASSRRFSRDAIAEFQVVANRFDATQGRSSGHDRQCHHQVGNERAHRHVRRLFPRTTSSTPKDFISSACCRTRISRSARPSAAPSFVTACTSSSRTGSSTSRGRSTPTASYPS